jgi:RHS repeat-associated protein
VRKDKTKRGRGGPPATVLSHTYSYDLGGGVNNGNIASLTNNLNTGRSQSYTYDTMNRLASAQSQATSGTDCWGDSYGYDRFGNLLTMTVTKCTAQNLNVTVDGNNHITGMSYDAAGNLTNDGTLTYSWDAENRLKTTAATNYKFDGDSLRVLKGTNDLYWYSAATCKHPLFGRSTSAGTYTDEFIHFNGQAVGYRDDAAAKVYHLVNDHLGSARVMTNATGVTQFESDYYPHGAARVITSTKDSLLKFQGKQQDTESGLDNVRRMYSPTLARFLPTRIATVPTKSRGVPHPQSLNPSTLAASNPVIHPNGLISNFINIVLRPTPTPGSEGNNPCADFGCFPGPPDLVDVQLVLTSECTCNGPGTKPSLFGTVCGGYSCSCFGEQLPEPFAFSYNALKRDCGWRKSTCPQVVEGRQSRIRTSVVADILAKKCFDHEQPN